MGVVDEQSLTIMYVWPISVGYISAYLIFIVIGLEYREHRSSNCSFLGLAVSADSTLRTENGQGSDRTGRAESPALPLSLPSSTGSLLLHCALDISRPSLSCKYGLLKASRPQVPMISSQKSLELMMLP